MRNKKEIVRVRRANIIDVLWSGEEKLSAADWGCLVVVGIELRTVGVFFCLVFIHCKSSALKISPLA